MKDYQLHKKAIFLLFLSSWLILSCANPQLTLYREGRDLYQKKDYPAAKEKFVEFKEKYPDSDIKELIPYYLEKIENDIKAKEKPNIPESIIIDSELGNLEEKGGQVAPYADVKLLSNVFYDTDIREILRNLSVEANVNIIADDTVQGFLSLKYDNQPLEEVLRMVLAPGGYTFSKKDGYYLVGFADPNSPSFDLLSNTLYYKPRYLKAKELFQLLPPAFATSVQVNEQRNILTVTSSPERINRILNDIKKLDKKIAQVMLQAVIIEISHNGRKSLGLDWTWLGGSERLIPSETKGEVSMSSLLWNLSYATGGEYTRSITATIRALVETGDATIRATPQVAALDGEEASIFIGE